MTDRQPKEQEKRKQVMAKESFEFGFQYSGPRTATDDRKCATCSARATKECPTHGQAYSPACAHCKSAQGAECQAHWGLQAAVDEFASRLEGEAAEDFKMASAMVLNTESKHPNVTVHVRSDRDGGTKGGRAFFVELVPRP